MANFFTRPNLEDRQFIQDVNDILTLSGTNNFVGTLQYKGVEIDATVTGASSGDALIYDGSKILLKPATAATTNIFYTGNSPSNITVGGLSAGTTLTGRSFTSILQEILITTFFPTLTSPSNAFSDDQANVQEVGKTIDITFSASFSRGSINPQYSASSAFRSGVPVSYNYTGNGLTSTVTSSALTDTQNVTGYTIVSGANSWTNTVTYEAGVQPTDSDGNNFNSPLPSGTTSSKTSTITGIYPYFYGTVSSSGASAGGNRPSATTALVTGGTKVVASSDGIISINFLSTNDDYLWFAIPSSSTPKTVWYINALNNGLIGGSVSAGGNLFPDPDTLSVSTVLWSGISYDVYISNYQTEATSDIQLRNS